MRNIRSLAASAIAAGAVLAMASSSRAAVLDIPITNGDFENPIITGPADTNIFQIPAWTFEGASGNAGIKKDPYPLATPQDAFAKADAGPVFQTTNWTISQGETFTLKAYSKSLWNFPGYTLSLYASDAQGNRTLLGTPATGISGGWALDTVQYTAGSAEAGQKIGVQFAATTNTSSDAWLAMDTVSLTVDAVPEPAAMGMVAGSVVLLGCRRRHLAK